MFSSNIFRLTCAREDLVVSSQEKHLYSLLNKIFSIEREGGVFFLTMQQFFKSSSFAHSNQHGKDRHDRDCHHKNLCG